MLCGVEQINEYIVAGGGRYLVGERRWRWWSWLYGVVLEQVSMWILVMADR